MVGWIWAFGQEESVLWKQQQAGRQWGLELGLVGQVWREAASLKNLGHLEQEKQIGLTQLWMDDLQPLPVLLLCLRQIEVTTLVVRLHHHWSDRQCYLYSVSRQH